MITEYMWDIEHFWFKFKIFIIFEIENLRFNLENDTDVYLNEHIFLSTVSITPDTQFYSSILTDS